MPAPKTADRVTGDSAGAGFWPPTPTQRKCLIADVTVEHGPVDLLGRFFLKADTATRQRGVALEFGTFEELLQVNCQEPGHLETHNIDVRPALLPPGSGA